MSRVVFKYRVPSLGESEIELPVNATLLSIHEQNGSVQLWALADPDELLREGRRLIVTMTGQRFDYDDLAYTLRFIGTAHMESGRFIVHVFELTPRGR